MDSQVPPHRHRFGFIGVLCLIALRMSVGWHFFGDGVKKLDPDFRSAWFLQQSTGPFANQFLDLIPDRFGTDRLDRAKIESRWDQFSQTANRQLKLDQGQKEKSASLLKSYLKRLDRFFADNGDEIRKHRLEVRRLREARRQSTADLESQQAWISSRDTELQAEAKPWLAHVAALEENLYQDLTALASDSRSAKALRPLPDLSDKTWVDHSVTIFTIAVGVCLLLGALTVPAAVLGAGFLLSVMLTQPFWAPGANLMVFPYQLVEFCALLFLAAVSAGRYGGLDFFWWAWRHQSKIVD